MRSNAAGFAKLRFFRSLFLNQTIKKANFEAIIALSKATTEKLKAYLMPNL